MTSQEDPTQVPLNCPLAVLAASAGLPNRWQGLQAHPLPAVLNEGP